MALDAPSAARLRIAVDIGGTFTDLAAFDEAAGELLFGKALSTHGALVDGIQNTVDGAGVAFRDAHLFLHGSTIAINTLLERTGARTALLVTEGFRDIYEIGRVNRPDAYNLFFRKHQPLVDRSARHEVRERLMASGAVHKPLDEDHLRSVLRSLKPTGVEAVAILLLHSYRNPAHEMRVKQIAEEELPGVFVTASHELSQEYREFERVSTVAANAYVGPRVATYLGELSEHLERQGFGGAFFVVQSTGGLFPVEHARRDCVRMLESGPAAGVIGTQAICEGLGLKDAIAFDMGGTTAKAGVIYEGKPLTTGSALIGGYDQALPIQIPMIDIFEVGTGGGSIARLEQGNALRVGPQSAGSMPGPVCYGRGGTNPTVTDANLLLGRLDPDHFLGGEMKLDLKAAERAMWEKLAEPLRMDALQAADGILRIAVTTMSHAVKAVTTERGLDVGGFTMAVYGGAGPLHASAIAREIGIRRIMIPYAPGYFSAYGMLFSDLRYDYVRSCFRRLGTVDFAEIEGLYTSMEEEGTRGDRGLLGPARERRHRARRRHALRRAGARGDRGTAAGALRAGRTARPSSGEFDAPARHPLRHHRAGRTGGAGQPARDRERASCASRPATPSPRAGRSPTARALSRRKPVYFRRPGGHAGLPARPAAGGQPHRGPGADRGARLHHRAGQPGDALEVDAAGNLQIAIGSEAR